MPAALSVRKSKAVTEMAKKETKHRPVAAHPPVAEMVTAAIKALKDRKGTSLPAIKKYVSANYSVDIAKMNSYIKRFLRSAVTAGKLVQVKGTGANGSFKLSAATKDQKPKKPPIYKPPKKPDNKPPPYKPPPAKHGAKTSPVKAKKPAAKELAAKKPAAKKPAVKKPAAKKPAAKKPAVKKPAAKKPAAKKPAAKKPAAEKPAAEKAVKLKLKC